MKFKEQFKKDCPETVGETDQNFDRLNYIGWLDNLLTEGSLEIAKERVRQINKEGWTPEHDDEHTDGELSSAACVYAMKNELRELDVMAQDIYKMGEAMWPWDEEWFKPTPNERVRELTKAGALIAAEIERLKRKEGNA